MLAQPVGRHARNPAASLGLIARSLQASPMEHQPLPANRRKHEDKTSLSVPTVPTNVASSSSLFSCYKPGNSLGIHFDVMDFPSFDSLSGAFYL